MRATTPYMSKKSTHQVTCAKVMGHIQEVKQREFVKTQNREKLWNTREENVGHVKKTIKELGLLRVKKVKSRQN